MRQGLERRRIRSGFARYARLTFAFTVAASLGLSSNLAVPAHAFEKGPEQGPEVGTDRQQYLPTDAVLLEAEGFDPSVQVEISISAGEPGTSIQTHTYQVQTEPDGGFAFSVPADPDGALGLHEVDATDGGETAQTFYDVSDHYDATVVTDAGAYLADGSVTLTGSHFASSTSVEIKLVDPDHAFRTLSATTDAQGWFETSFPASAGALLGTYTVAADDGTGMVETAYDVTDQLGKVRVGFCGGDDWEPDIASDPYGHVYSVYTHFAGATNCPGGLAGNQREYVQVSNDGGTTFGNSIMVFPPPIGGLNYTNEADPVITVDEQGVVYFATLAWGAQTNRTDVLVAKSTDFGQTWPISAIKKVNGTAPSNPCLDCDHQWIVARGSNIYVEYTGASGRHYLSRSADGGATWAESIILTTASTSVPFAEGAVIDAAGNAWFAWADCRNSNCNTATAVDFRVAKTIAGTSTTTFTIPAPGGTSLVAPQGPNCSPSCGFAFYGPQDDIAIDAAGNLYLVWQDGQVHATAQSPPIIRLASCPGTSDCTVASNWVDKGRVDDKDSSAAPNDCKDATNAVVCRAVFPRVEGSSTVAGRIAVQWIDDRKGSDPPSGFTKQSHTQGWNTYVRTSNNGGTSWTGPGQQLSSFANDPNRPASRVNGFGFPYGDYEGLTFVCGTGVRTGSTWGEGINYTGGATNHGNVIVETAGPLPLAPTSLTVSGSTATQVSIGWAASGTPGATNYRIYRGTSLGNLAQVGQVASNTLSFTDTPPAGNSFLYAISTLTADGEGCRSERLPVLKATFAQTGIGGDTGLNTVIVAGGSNLSAADLPATRYLQSGASWTFSSSVLSSTVVGKHYDLTSTQSGVLSTGSAGTTITGTYVRVKADQTIAMSIADRTYGDANFDPGATATSGLPVSYSAIGDCSITGGGLVHIVQAGSCTVTAGQDGDADDYNAAPDLSKTFAIGKATLTVTADPKTKLLNAIDPPFTFGYSGFQFLEGPGDLATQPTCGVSGPHSAIGSYDITCSGGAANNYAFQYVKGTLTVIYNFTGFFSPVDNLPTVNVVKAGSAVPVKFSLAGNQGLNIFAPGYPRVQPITCDSHAPTDAIEETVNAGNSSLSYDPGANQYNYVWKTEKAWIAGTCRELQVKLADGTTYTADFKFK